MKINTKRKFWILFWILEVYILSYFLFLKPCENVNRCPVSLADFRRPGVVYPDIYPVGTIACVSENKVINYVAYYVYWPLNKLSELRGHWYFIKDPDLFKDS